MTTPSRADLGWRGAAVVDLVGSGTGVCVLATWRLIALGRAAGGVSDALLAQDYRKMGSS
jgi:hypothetical protein